MLISTNNKQPATNVFSDGDEPETVCGARGGVSGRGGNLATAGLLASCDADAGDASETRANELRRRFEKETFLRALARSSVRG